MKLGEANTEIVKKIRGDLGVPQQHLLPPNQKTKSKSQHFTSVVSEVDNFQTREAGVVRKPGLGGLLLGPRLLLIVSPWPPALAPVRTAPGG